MNPVRISTHFRRLGLPMIAAASFLAAPASATLLVYDGFNYTAGDTVGTSSSNGNLSGGTGWGSARWYDNQSPGANAYTVTNGGLSYGDLTVAGNALSQTTDNIGALRSFGSTLTTGTYYLSYLVSFSGNSTATAGQYAGLQLGSVYFGLANLNGGATTTREFVVSNSYGGGSNGTTRMSTGVTMTTGQTYLVVAKIEFSTTGADTYSLWINSTVSGEANAGTAQAVNTTTDSSSISSATFYTSGTLFGMTVDEFRLGTTWADVTAGLPVTAVPEPGAWTSLAGVCGLACAVLRRRRRLAAV